MSSSRDRTPVSLRLGAVWLFCGLVGAVSACAGGAGDSRADAAPSDADVCVPGCTDGTGIRACVPVEAVTPCVLGCDPGAPVCREIVPSNGATRDLLVDVTAELRVSAAGALVINTDTGQIENLRDDSIVRPAGEGVENGIRFQKLDDGISAFAVDSLTIERDGAIVGDGLNALLLLSEGDVTIEGRIIMSACCEQDALANKVDADDVPGPGGSFGAVPGMFPAEGCAPGRDGESPAVGEDETGGGGGGLGADGAPGGLGLLGTAPGAGGDSSSTECPGPALVPLRGGSGGGAGGTGASAGAGGAGGGAIQITSFTRILLNGKTTGFVQGILANGGGGGPGDDTNGGGGGGSGGAILLEAPEITIGAMMLVANGGGGGGSGDATEARAGQLGRPEDVQAVGGLGPRAGGRGGALTGSATIGVGGADGTGGGGGGVGIIRLNVPAEGLTLAFETISPTYTRGDPQLR